MPQIREQIAMVHLPPSKTLKYLFHVRKTEKAQGFFLCAFSFCIYEFVWRDSNSSSVFLRKTASLEKRGGLPQGKPEGFSQKIDFKKKVFRFLIPQSSSMTAPFTREPNLSPLSAHFVRSRP